MIELKDNFIYEIFFVHSSASVKVAKYILESCKIFVVVVFTISAIWEFFTNCNYKDLILRTILCLILLSCYQLFLNKSIEHSFVFSNNLYKMSAAEDSRLVKVLKKWKKDEGNISKKDNYMDRYWDFLKKNILVPVGDFVSVLIWFFIYLFFMILKITYSVTFYLLYIFLPIQALLSIFGPTSSSLRGALASYFTLMLTPVVTVVILIILGEGASTVASIKDYEFVESFKGLVQFLIAIVLLLFASSFASSLLDSTGVGQVSNRINQKAAGAILMTSISSVIDLTKNVFSKNGQTKKKTTKGGLLNRMAKGVVNKVIPGKSLRSNKNRKKSSMKIKNEKKVRINKKSKTLSNRKKKLTPSNNTQNASEIDRPIKSRMHNPIYRKRLSAEEHLDRAIYKLGNKQISKKKRRTAPEYIDDVLRGDIKLGREPKSYKEAVKQGRVWRKLRRLETLYQIYESPEAQHRIKVNKKRAIKLKKIRIKQ